MWLFSAVSSLGEAALQRSEIDCTASSCHNRQFMQVPIEYIDENIPYGGHFLKWENWSTARCIRGLVMPYQVHRYVQQ